MRGQLKTLVSDCGRHAAMICIHDGFTFDLHGGSSGIERRYSCSWLWDPRSELHIGGFVCGFGCCLPGYTECRLLKAGVIRVVYCPPGSYVLNIFCLDLVFHRVCHDPFFLASSRMLRDHWYRTDSEYGSYPYWKERTLLQYTTIGVSG